jgi:ATP-dependent exoDNAse (exonuclease V) alpha subunit
VLVGDPQQLQAIEAGAAFRSMAERHGAVEITEVRRQAEEWQRDATRQLATGRTGEALEAYHAAGLVVRSPTRETARDALIERWDADQQAHPEASRLILTHTNAECDELNAQARDRLRDHGTLGADVAVETTRGQRLFADQDRIMFLRNERELGVKNGMLATIERVDRTGMAVRLDDGRAVVFDHKDYADLNHGYAATVHKSQGRRSTGFMSWQRLGSIAMAPMSRSHAIAITSRCITARPTLPTASGWPSGYRATGPRTWRATTPARTKTES